LEVFAFGSWLFNVGGFWEGKGLLKGKGMLKGNELLKGKCWREIAEGGK
jgi:hypothetical protein